MDSVVWWDYQLLREVDVYEGEQSLGLAGNLEVARLVYKLN